MHGVRDCLDRTGPRRARGRCRATAVPGNRADGRRAGQTRRGPTRVPSSRAGRLPARVPRVATVSMFQRLARRFAQSRPLRSACAPGPEAPRLAGCGGGERAAAMYTLIVTAKFNDVEPTDLAGEHRHVKSSTVAGHAPAAEMARLRRASGVGAHRVRVSDVMHGPKLRHGRTRRKSYLIAFIDHADTRIMPRRWPGPLQVRAAGRGMSA